MGGRVRRRGEKVGVATGAIDGGSSCTGATHLRFPVHREHGRVEAHVVAETALGGHLMAGAPLLVLHFSIWRSSTSACTLISSTLTRSVEASGPALMMARIVSRSTCSVRGTASQVMSTLLCSRPSQGEASEPSLRCLCGAQSRGQGSEKRRRCSSRCGADSSPEVLMNALMRRNETLSSSRVVAYDAPSVDDLLRPSR